MGRKASKVHLHSLKAALRSSKLKSFREEISEEVDAARQIFTTQNFEPVDVKDVEKRREILSSNSDLNEIFSAFWLTFLPFCDESGILGKEGYMKLDLYLQYALVGADTDDEKTLHEHFENDWQHVCTSFGPIDQKVFFDILFEVIDHWSEIVDPFYFSVLAWSLFDSIADSKKQPPKLRAKKSVKCITEINGAMVGDFVKTKKLRAKMAIGTKWLVRAPEVQRRLTLRKTGSVFGPELAAVIESMSKHSFSEAAFSDSEDETESDLVNSTLADPEGKALDDMNELHSLVVNGMVTESFAAKQTSTKGAGVTAEAIAQLQPRRLSHFYLLLSAKHDEDTEISSSLGSTADDGQTGAVAVERRGAFQFNSSSSNTTSNSRSHHGGVSNAQRPGTINGMKESKEYDYGGDGADGISVADKSIASVSDHSEVMRSYDLNVRDSDGKRTGSFGPDRRHSGDSLGMDTAFASTSLQEGHGGDHRRSEDWNSNFNTSQFGKLNRDLGNEWSPGGYFGSDQGQRYGTGGVDGVGPPPIKLDTPIMNTFSRNSELAEIAFSVASEDTFAAAFDERVGGNVRKGMLTKFDKLSLWMQCTTKSDGSRPSLSAGRPQSPGATQGVMAGREDISSTWSGRALASHSRPRTGTRSPSSSPLRPLAVGNEDTNITASSATTTTSANAIAQLRAEIDPVPPSAHGNARSEIWESFGGLQGSIAPRQSKLSSNPRQIPANKSLRSRQVSPSTSMMSSLEAEHESPSGKCRNADISVKAGRGQSCTSMGTVGDSSVSLAGMTDDIDSELGTNDVASRHSKSPATKSTFLPAFPTIIDGAAGRGAQWDSSGMLDLESLRVPMPRTVTSLTSLSIVGHCTVSSSTALSPTSKSSHVDVRSPASAAHCVLDDEISTISEATGMNSMAKRAAPSHIRNRSHHDIVGDDNQSVGVLSVRSQGSTSLADLLTKSSFSPDFLANAGSPVERSHGEGLNKRNSGSLLMEGGNMNSAPTECVVSSATQASTSRHLMLSSSSSSGLYGWSHTRAANTKKLSIRKRYELHCSAKQAGGRSSSISLLSHYLESVGPPLEPVLPKCSSFIPFGRGRGDIARVSLSAEGGQGSLLMPPPLTPMEDDLDDALRMGSSLEWEENSQTNQNPPAINVAPKEDKSTVTSNANNMSRGRSGRFKRCPPNVLDMGQEYFNGLELQVGASESVQVTSKSLQRAAVSIEKKIDVGCKALVSSTQLPPQKTFKLKSIHSVLAPKFSTATNSLVYPDPVERLGQLQANHIHDQVITPATMQRGSTTSFVTELSQSNDADSTVPPTQVIRTSVSLERLSAFIPHQNSTSSLGKSSNQPTSLAMKSVASLSTLQSSGGRSLGSVAPWVAGKSLAALDSLRGDSVERVLDHDLLKQHFVHDPSDNLVRRKRLGAAKLNFENYISQIQTNTKSSFAPAVIREKHRVAAQSGSLYLGPRR